MASGRFLMSGCAGTDEPARKRKGRIKKSETGRMPPSPCFNGLTNTKKRKTLILNRWNALSAIRPFNGSYPHGKAKINKFIRKFFL